MKIAFIGQKGIPTQYGGIERHIEELSVRLAKAGHKVFVYSRPNYSNPNKKSYKGVNLISLPSIPTKNLDAISHTFLASIHALFQGFDIIHYHGVGPSTLSFIPRIFKPKIKVVTTFHCRDKFHQKWGKLAQLYLGFGEFATCKFPHKTIAVSRNIKKFCEKKFNIDALYIPNGVFTKNVLGNEKIKKFGLGKENYILTVARLVKHKGIHYLIKAYKNIKTDKKLVIVGDSSHTENYVEYLKKLAKNNPNIIFCGFQKGETLAQLFKNAYIYIHPSEAEGLPITVLEALSYGKCALVSDIPENLEAIDNFGFTFKNKSVKDLQNKLQYLLNHSQEVKKIAKETKNYVGKNYNWDDITLETISLYESLFQKSRTKEIKPMIVRN